VRGISKLVAAVKPSADHVVVMGDPPSLVFQPVDCLGAEGATLGTCTHKLSAVQTSAYESARQAATDAGAAFMETIGWFCYEQQCPAVVGHTEPYRISDHITQTYALELRALFRSALMRALES
jgi:hypothetical protein